MAGNEKPIRFWYEYKGQKEQVPPEYIYKVEMGGGYDINEAFFTWAFNKHNISITDIRTEYVSDNRTPKGEKGTTAAGSVFVIAIVKGKDKYGMEKVGDGEAGNENITNYQRKFPAGIAIKRAKVNMGKEFFNLTDLRLATDCRDIVINFGDHKGKSLAQIASTKEGINTIRWFASEKFNGDAILKAKAQEVINLYIDKNSTNINKNNNNTTNTHTTNNTTNATNNTTSTDLGNSEGKNENKMTQTQKDIISKYKNEKKATDITKVAKEVISLNFDWEKATELEINKLIESLESKYGKL